ncbi:MAG: type II toxin-antitoxin system RelE/ParE family toxin [Planctomycetaceae bacterium]|jgi:plasmid stabilization system protein ParE|nr:type II toxin-antitoxin system RelE/ParE family toxin [Planctomycetaceae bacterium]
MKLLPLSSNEAELDITMIVAYYNVQSNTADRFRVALNKTVEYLCEFPESGTKCRFQNPQYAGARMRTLDKPFNKYLIFFRQKGETLQFLRIIHGARNFKTLFK